MRHRHGYNKLSMKSSHRRAVLRNMATSLLLHERVNTTLPKAKELRGIVDHIITLGKQGDLHSRRQASSFLFDDSVTQKVFVDLAERFKDRKGGYTRILRKGPRLGDGAEVATIELVDFDFSKIQKEKKETKTKKTEQD